VRVSSLLVVVVVAACSGSSAPSGPLIGDRSSTIDSVQVNGPLRLEARDMPLASATVPFPAASVTGATGVVVASNWQYGSLCQYSIAGNADVRGGKIGVHVVLTPRLALCTADVRVLQYTGTVTAAPGTYDVALVRELNGAQDTIARQTVTVR
jgi:hypothetical protein